FLYDDYGSDTDGQGATGLSPRVGDIKYPTNTARYGGNAADIVELRIAVAPDSVAYRITLNTLLEADSTIVVLAFDTDHNAATGGIFNLGFRFGEAVAHCQTPPDTLHCDVPPDTNQSVSIRNKTPTDFAHDIDFAKLDAAVTESTVPATGLQMRIFASRLDLG